MLIVFSIDKKVIARVQVKGIITIGSSNYCDVCIPDSSVDENQCRIILSNGGLYLQNTGHNKPIILNKSIVDEEMIVELQEGILTIGDVNVEVSFMNKLPASNANDSKRSKNLVFVVIGSFITLALIIGLVINLSSKSEDIVYETETVPTVIESETVVELINLSDVIISPIEEQLYTGSAINCPIEVSIGGNSLVEGADYTCVYENNIGVGASTITLLGNDVTTTGRNSISFNIITGDDICDQLENGDVVNYVSGLYINALNRYPEPFTLITYVNQLVNQDITASDVIGAIYNSEEFLSRNLSDEAFITSVYRSVLNREPDDEGFNSHLTLLSNGMTRYDLINNIVGASEFDGLCETIGIVSQIEPLDSEDIILPDGQYFVIISLNQFFGTNDYSSLSFALLEYYTFTAADINNLHPGDIVNLRGWNAIEDEIVVSDNYSASDTYPILTDEDNLYILVPNSNSSLWYLSTYDDYSICRNVGNYTLPVSNSVTIDDTVYTYYNNMYYSDNAPHIVNSFENTTLNAEVLGEVTGVSDAANGWISVLYGTITVRNNQIVSATLYQRIWHTFE